MMTLFKEGFTNYVEHPRGVAYIRTEYGVKLRVTNGSGQVLYSFDYTASEWDQVNAAMAGDWMDVPVPVDVVGPPEPTPDPAPRAPKPDPEPVDETDKAPRAPSPGRGHSGAATGRRTTG